MRIVNSTDGTAWISYGKYWPVPLVCDTLKHTRCYFNMVIEDDLVFTRADN